MSWLTEEERAEAEEMLDIPFELYKRSVFVYLPPQDVITSSSPSFNFAYPEEQNPDAIVTHTPVTGQFDATISYATSEDDQKQLTAVANVNIKQDKLIARISVKPESRDLMERAERIEFDGKNHNLISPAIPRGLFAPNYYDFWVQETS